MHVRVELVANFGNDRLDPVLLEGVQQFTHRQLDAFDQRRGLFGFLARRFQRALHVVVDGQQIARQFRPAVHLGFAALLVGPLARVFGIRHRAHPLVLQPVTFRTQGVDFDGFVVHLVDLIRIGIGLGGIDVIQEIVVFRSSHCLPLTPVRDHPAYQLRGVIHNRHDASIVQPRGPDDPDRTDDLSVRVHIGRDHQRGTRK